MESKMELVHEDIETFHKLMINKDKNLVVLFTIKEVGQVVFCSSSLYDIGYLTQEWIMDNFTDFHGTITLTA